MISKNYKFLPHTFPQLLVMPGFIFIDSLFALFIDFLNSLTDRIIVHTLSVDLSMMLYKLFLFVIFYFLQSPSHPCWDAVARWIFEFNGGRRPFLPTFSQEVVERWNFSLSLSLSLFLEYIEKIPSLVWNIHVAATNLKEITNNNNRFLDATIPE